MSFEEQFCLIQEDPDLEAEWGYQKEDYQSTQSLNLGSKNMSYQVINVEKESKSILSIIDQNASKLAPINSIKKHKNRYRSVVRKELTPIQQQTQPEEIQFYEIKPKQQKFIVHKCAQCLKLSKQTKKYKFTKDSLMDIYLKNLPSQELRYVAEPGQKPIYFQYFLRLKAELGYCKTRQSVRGKISKIRTTIVRRVLDEYVSHHCPSSSHINHIDKYNRRLTKEDRNRYNRMMVPEPPSRMTDAYYQQIFKRVEFQVFYSQYVYQNHLKTYLTKANKAHVQQHSQKIYEILSKYYAMDEEAERKLISINRKPLFSCEIVDYVQISREMAKKYCKLKQANQNNFISIQS